MTAIALGAPATRPLPALQLPSEDIHPSTKPLQILTPTAPTRSEPTISARVPRRSGDGLVLTGTETRLGVRFAWLLDARATPLGPSATSAVLGDLQEMLRTQLVGAPVSETMQAAHQHLMRTTTSRAIPFSAALVREVSGVLEVAVLGTATVKLHETSGRTRTVTCRRPHRRKLETIGISVDVTTDPANGRPAELEVHRAPRPPRHPIPVLGAAERTTGRAGYGVAASHLRESVHIRAGRILHR